MTVAAVQQSAQLLCEKGCWTRRTMVWLCQGSSYIRNLNKNWLHIVGIWFNAIKNRKIMISPLPPNQLPDKDSLLPWAVEIPNYPLRNRTRTAIGTDDKQIWIGGPVPHYWAKITASSLQHEFPKGKTLNSWAGRRVEVRVLTDFYHQTEHLVQRSSCLHHGVFPPDLLTHSVSASTGAFSHPFFLNRFQNWSSKVLPSNTNSHSLDGVTHQWICKKKNCSGCVRRGNKVNFLQFKNSRQYHTTSQNCTGYLI